MLIPVWIMMQKIRGIRISGLNFSSRQMLMVPDRPIIRPTTVPTTEKVFRLIW